MYQLNPLLIVESFGFDAEIDYDPKKLDSNKLKLLSSPKYSNLINTLDKWVLFPDASLLPDLIKLSKIIDSLYPKFNSQIIYRGFDISGIQDTMGLVNKGFFSSSLKDDVKIGYKFKYHLNKTPLSFTTDLNIAKAFGHMIVKSKMPKNKLVITDELNELIRIKRNLKEYKTQKEVIVFPNQDILCEVVKI